jgi:NADH:ubiquinone oxidoreductase subunit 6 (subunit J)
MTPLPLLIAVKIGVYVVMALCVAAALAVVLLRNIFHAALALAAALILIAGIYLALQAEFLGIVQVLIYVGAVMTLVIFTIMLTHGLEDKSISQQNTLSLPAMAGAIVLFGLLWKLIQNVPWPVKESTLSARVSISNLASALMGPYVFPFEFISVVLLVALVGAIVIAKKEKPS